MNKTIQHKMHLAAFTAFTAIGLVSLPNILMAKKLANISTSFNKVEVTISGKITDAATGESIPGASIALKGTNKGTIADAQGNFKISVPSENSVLVISAVGYTTQTINVAGQNTLNIKLAADSKSLSDVVVVGSRSTAARTNTQSAVPVDVITPAELKGFSQVDVGQILNYVAPSFNSNRQTVADGTDHVDPASLRGLGPDQVLVLVNGKRRHTSALMNINGTVGRGSVGTDMNVIPVAAIERIEILRDGASAQYGSDAIAGVINIVLKKNDSGLMATLNTGINNTTMHWDTPVLGGGTKANHLKINDGAVLQFDLSKGFNLGNKGALTISGQYNEHGNTNRAGYDNAPTIYLGASGGFPGTPAGQVQNDFRTKLIADDAALATSRNYDRRNMVFGNSNSRNLGMFLNGDYALGAKTTAYFSGGVTHRTGKGFGNNRVPVSRAQQPLNADGSLVYPDGFLPAIASVIDDQSVIAGVKTKFGDWKMDLSNTYGKNSFNFNVENSGNASLPNGANQTKFDAGTLNFDQNTTNLDFSRLFEKVGPINGLNIAFGAEYRRDHYKIEAGEANSYIGADLKKTVTGAPLVVGGPGIGTTLALPGAQVFPGFQPSDAIDKARTNLGFYGDVEGDLFDRLFVGIAGRFEDYSDFGSNFSGKIATRLKLTDGIALRGSVSAGFRAPSLHQRYFQNTSTQFVSGLPSNTLTVNNDNPIARTVIGVDALKPETSKSATIGVTAKLGKMSLTVDAYKIDIEDRIVYSGGFSRGLLGFTADQYVGINNVNFFANAANTSTKGLDMVLSGKYKIGSNGLSFMASANFNKNKVESINSTTLIDSPAKNDPAGNPNTWFKNLLFDRQQISRIEVWQPLNKLNLSVTYSVGKFDITARGMRFGEVQYVHNVYTNAKKADGTFWNTAFNRDATGNALIDQTFKPVVIADLIVGYKLGNNYNISIGANNILDTYPDQNYIDPRNASGSLDYASGRDASNRGRLLYQPNQGGYNGRHVFARFTATFK